MFFWPNGKIKYIYKIKKKTLFFILLQAGLESGSTLRYHINMVHGISEVPGLFQKHDLGSKKGKQNKTKHDLSTQKGKQNKTKHKIYCWIPLKLIALTSWQQHNLT